MTSAKLGQHQELFTRELRRFEAARWLRPDASLAALDDEATTWLRERLDELLASLAEFAPDDSLPVTITLATTRSMHDAERRWRNAWEREDAAQPGAVLLAIERAAAAIPAARGEKPRRRRYAIDTLVGRATEPASARLDELAVKIREGTMVIPISNIRALTSLVRRHLEWIVAFGDTRLSPFRPLIDIWLRGAWPALLPDDGAVVYVPIEHDGAVITWIDGDPINPNPERASLAKHGPRRQPVASEERTRLPTWWELGVSQPLVFDLHRNEVLRMGRVAVVRDDPAD